MRKLPARKLLGAVVAAALLIPSSGYTLGLGEIEVNSSLNQQLNADIELLSASPEDAETIIIKLASRKEFLRAGIDRPYLLNDLRFKSEIINGVPYIKVSSASPIREPFLNFLVEIDWPNGHLLREYTVLLDPPVFMTQPAARATSSSANEQSESRPSASGSNNVIPVAAPGMTLSPRPAATSQSAPVRAAPMQPAPVAQQPVTQSNWIPAPVMQQQASINQPAGTYKINEGDTAWSLADAMRPDQSITVPQMMIAMLRTNPESFIDGNINGLKRGYILRVPDYDQIKSVSAQEANELMKQQAALWRQYQQSQSGGEPASAMESDGSPAADAAASGDKAVREDEAYLEIVSAGTGSSTLSGKDPTQMTAQELRAELALARERVETELVEKEALQQRVEILESNVNKMKGMLSIEDAELAEVESLGQQEGVMPADEPVEAMQGEAPAEEAVTEETVTQESDEAVVEDGAVEAEADGEIDPEALESMADDELLTKEVEAESTPESAVFTDEVADAESAEMAEPLAQDMPASGDIVTAEPEGIASEPAGPVTQLLNNPMMLAAAGGGLLLLTALIGLIIKRRKAAGETADTGVVGDFDDLESLADDIAGEAVDDAVEVESLAGDSDAAADFDSDATMVLDPGEDTIISNAESIEEAEEEARDDVIAEADVYLAYGIYQQAEELLTQAIEDNPDRDDYRVKLAETHYASKNADAFTQTANQLKSRVESDSAVWKKVMSMGQDLCPDIPMFQGDMVGGVDVDNIAPVAPEMDFDLGVDDASADTGAHDLDLELGDEALELPEMDAATEAPDEETPDQETAAEPVDELEFDLSDAGAVEEPAATEDEFSLDIDASELDIEIEDETRLDATEDEVTEVSDVDIDFGLEDDTAAEDTEEEISLDLTTQMEALDLDDGEAGLDSALADLELDIESDAATGQEAETESAPEAETIAASSDDEDDDFDLSSLDDVDEISTKLDLARAYLDMGDHEGTRGILDEVIAEGNDEQKKEANELMEKLG